MKSDIVQVASYTGAWIETPRQASDAVWYGVASYTGAWIETSENIDANPLICVASYTGAWIETSLTNSFGIHTKSHPIRVRGLKHIIPLCQLTHHYSCILYGCVD